MGRIRRVARWLGIAGRRPPARSLVLKDSDVCLVSYPKSGNTWLRYLLLYSIWPEIEEADLTVLGRHVPDGHARADLDSLADPTAPCNQVAPRLIKRHNPYDPEVKRVVYVVRDGRDALTSYWHYHTQRSGEDLPFSEFLPRAVEISGSWREHVTGWMDADVPARLVVRYEDMLADAGACLQNVLDFIGIERDPQVVSDAVDRASFGKLKRLEEKKGLGWKKLENVEFMRKGVVGDWERVFGPGDLERFNEIHGGPVPELGYVW